MPLTICPIAIAVGCRKCPIFKVCPVKSVIGDQPSAPETPASDAPTVRGKSRRKSKPKRRG